MAFKPPVAVYDACVLYPFHLRNVLVQCAFDGLVEARWTDDIHGEWIRNLAANTPTLPIERLVATSGPAGRRRRRLSPFDPGPPNTRSRLLSGRSGSMLASVTILPVSMPRNSYL